MTSLLFSINFCVIKVFVWAAVVWAPNCNLQMIGPEDGSSTSESSLTELRAETLTN